MSENFVLDESKAKIHMAGSAGCDGPVHKCTMTPTSLSKMSYYSTVYFKKPDSPDSYGLPSVTAPFADSAVAITLFGTLLCMTFVLPAVMKKPRDIISTSLSIFSGLIGKYLVVNRNPKNLLLYSFWLLLAGVISVTYTNILQSHVVVPGVCENDLSFEEMTRQNYSFESVSWKWMKYAANDSSYEASSYMAARERKLSEKVSQIGKYLRIGSDLNEFVQYYSGTTKRVQVNPSDDIESFKLIPLITEWDLVVGEEKFFNVPLWWEFTYVERASLLARSVELLKEAGLAQYFVQLANRKFVEAVVAGNKENKLKLRNAPAKTHRRVPECRSASLDDALVRECFVLFMYGNLIAAALFLAEQLTSVVIQLFHASTVSVYIISSALPMPHEP